MKKLLLVCVVLWLMGTGTPFAAGTEEILHESGADALYDALPEQVQDSLNGQGIDSADADAVLDLSFADILGALWESVVSSSGTPLKLLAAGVGLALLCALTAQVGGTLRDGSFSGAFDAASVLCAAAVLFPAVTGLFQMVSGLFEGIGNFLFSFVPVYSAILVSSGQPMSAALSEGTLLAAAQIVSVLSRTVLVPMLTVYLALCMVGAVCPELRMDGIAGAAKGAVTVTVGFLMTVFVGLLSLKGTLAGAADSVALRTAKFAASTVFPVVGSAVSEALASVKGSMTVLRASVGGFASIAVLFMMVPPIASLLLTQLVLSVSSAAAQILHADRIAALYKGTASAVSLLCGLTVVFGVLIIISLGILVRAAGG